MEFVVILVILLIIGGVALGFMPRGRRARHDSVEERPAATESPGLRPRSPRSHLLVDHDGRRMRLVIATCSVDYVGRLTAHLPTATRLLMVKADGSVSIHADDRAYKPLNWMSPPCRLDEGDGRWTVTNPKGEQLVITIDEVLCDSSHDLGADPGLRKDGVEAHLQELLADACHHLEEGLVLVRREHRTEIGPVDLLCRSEDGCTVVVEIKRMGEIAGVEQLVRYLERLGRDSALHPVRGVFVAQTVKPQARVLAHARDIRVVEVDYDALRGMREADLTLF
jgi:RecB family endonuclease NucS